MVESLVTGEALSTFKHRACVQRVRWERREINKDREEAQLAREKWSNNNRGKLRLERAMVAGAWLMVVPNLLNGAILSAEDFETTS